MQVKIQSPRITMSEDQEVFIIKKMGHLDKIYNRVQSCDVVFKVEKSRDQSSYVVEAKLIVPGHNLFARDAAESFEVAVDRVSAELEAQLQKLKDKQNNRHRKLEATISEDDSDF